MAWAYFRVATIQELAAFGKRYAVYREESSISRQGQPIDDVRSPLGYRPWETPAVSKPMSVARFRCAKSPLSRARVKMAALRPRLRGRGGKPQRGRCEAPGGASRCGYHRAGESCVV